MTRSLPYDTSYNLPSCSQSFSRAF